MLHLITRNNLTENQNTMLRKTVDASTVWHHTEENLLKFHKKKLEILVIQRSKKIIILP
jgi:hypothetical protein